MAEPSNDSPAERTEVWHGEREIINRGLQELANVKIQYDSIVDHNGPSIMVNNEIVTKAYANIRDRGCKIRLITEISVNNILYCKKLDKLLDLRHFDGIKGNLGIVDGIRYGASARSEEKKFPTEYIYSNVKSFVEQQQYFFDMLWNKSIPAEQRIKELEQGIKPNVLETITDPIKIQNLYLNLVRSAKTEIMLIIPTANAIHHQDDIGILQLLKDVSINHNNNVNTRILTSQINDHHFVEEQNIQNTLLSFPLSSFHIHLRNIEIDSTTKSTIIIVDRTESLVIEVKDDTKDTFIDSIGFATYSNSRATVLSYISIFESFWRQSDLLKKLRESEELQKDFIHIAAHELKNPIQPILGLSNLLMKHKPSDEKEFHNIVKVINRNAKKLIQLTNDILDVTKIETNNLNLNKELFNLSDLISDIIEDYRNQLVNENVKLISRFIHCNKSDNKEEKIESEKDKYHISIFADRNRINQVISNLVNNAIKFTNTGTIDIK